MKASDGRTHRRAIGSSRSFVPLLSPLRSMISPVRPALTPRASPRTGEGARRRTPFSPGEKVAGVSRPDEGLRQAKRRERDLPFSLAFALLASSPRPRAPTSASATRRTRSSISRSGRTPARPSKRRAGGSRRPAPARRPFAAPSRAASSISTRRTSTAWTSWPARRPCASTAASSSPIGADNCWRRGLQAVTFAEIDTLDSTDWTTFLTDPRK